MHLDEKWVQSWDSLEVICLFTELYTKPSSSQQQQEHTDHELLPKSPTRQFSHVPEEHLSLSASAPLFSDI